MEASTPSEAASKPSPRQTGSELTANALVNDGDFLVESGLEWSDTDLTTGWIIEPNVVFGGVTIGNKSFDSSTGFVRPKSSAVSVFKEGNGSTFLIFEEERIVNFVGGVELHHQLA
jgi:hypothetical protein